jgi:hypothetical protein
MAVGVQHGAHQAAQRHSLTKNWRRKHRPSGLGTPDQIHWGAVAWGAMAKDFFHNSVRRALEKDGWTVTHDQLPLEIGKETTMLIDLAAERLMVAERGLERIAVEVKGFTAASHTNEFHAVLGQYLNYRVALRILYPQHVLYLAIPADIFAGFFQRQFTKLILQEFSVKVLVYDPFTEVIVHEELF